MSLNHNIAELVCRSAERRPHGVALVAGDEHVAYAALALRVRAVAASLRQLGVGRGDHVVTAGANSAALLATYLAVAHAGAVNVPLNPLTDIVAARSVIAPLDPALLVATPECAALAAAIGEVHPGVGTVALGSLVGGDATGSADSAGPVNVQPDEPAVILLTSGTSGRARGCVKSHANLLWAAINGNLAWPRSAATVEYYPIPIAGIGFANFVLPTLLAGGTVVLDTWDAGRSPRLIEAEKVTRAFLPGTLLDAFLAADAADPIETASLEFLQTAYRLSEPLRRAIGARFGPIVHFGYGATEGVMAVGPADRFADAPACVGVPNGLDRIQIRGADGGPVPPETVGEIAVAGPTVMLGYLTENGVIDPHRTPDGWFCTGDLGHLDDTGQLHFDGRLKDVIKTGGVSVAAADVEDRIAGLAGVVDVAVVGVPDDRWGEAVCAVVVLTPTADLDEVVARSRNGMHGPRQPKRWLAVDSLPLNQHGKVAKDQLRKHFVDAVEEARS